MKQKNRNTMTNLAHQSLCIFCIWYWTLLAIWYTCTLFYTNTVHSILQPSVQSKNIRPAPSRALTLPWLLESSLHGVTSIEKSRWFESQIRASPVPVPPVPAGAPWTLGTRAWQNQKQSLFLRQIGQQLNNHSKTFNITYNLYNHCLNGAL